MLTGKFLPAGEFQPTGRAPENAANPAAGGCYSPARQ